MLLGVAAGTLLLSGVITLVYACAYLYLALRLARRTVPADAEATRALHLFAAWWGLTAVNQVGGSLMYVTASFGWTDLSVQVTYVVIQRLLLSGSMVGLMAYLLYLFRGRTRLVELCVVYGLFYAFQLWSVFGRGPVGVLVGRWRTDLVYASAAPLWDGLLTLVVLVLPPVVGCLAYLRLLPSAATRSARLRVGVVSFGLLVWWLLAVLAGRPETYDSDAIQLANRLVGLLVGLAVLFSFEPTRWMRRRFALEPYATAAPA